MDKQKPIKLEYNEGCMSWGTYINDKHVVDYPLEDIKNLVKDLIDSMDNKETNYFVLQKFLEEFIMEEGIYENLGKCEECGDLIDKYTYIYDSNKK